jgi:hypothetical protein
MCEKGQSNPHGKDMWKGSVTPQNGDTEKAAIRLLDYLGYDTNFLITSKICFYGC